MFWRFVDRNDFKLIVAAVSLPPFKKRRLGHLAALPSQNAPGISRLSLVPSVSCFRNKT